MRSDTTDAGIKTISQADMTTLGTLRVTCACLDSNFNKALAVLKVYGFTARGGALEDTSDALRQAGQGVLLQCLQHALLVCNSN